REAHHPDARRRRGRHLLPRARKHFLVRAAEAVRPCVPGASAPHDRLLTLSRTVCARAGPGRLLGCAAFMPTDPMFADLPPVLAAALENRGFVTLTPIQRAVLDPGHEGRDLRLFSQTGSGKTVAVGLVLAPDLERIAGEASAPGAAARPLIILIAPT